MFNLYLVVQLSRFHLHVYYDICCSKDLCLSLSRDNLKSRNSLCQAQLFPPQPSLYVMLYRIVCHRSWRLCIFSWHIRGFYLLCFGECTSPVWCKIPIKQIERLHPPYDDARAHNRHTLSSPCGDKCLLHISLG